MIMNIMKSLAGKYITFVLNEEEFGINILKVQEIIQKVEITKIPYSAEYIDGVINLRGKIIPTIDLRTKLGMERSVGSDRKCIIIVHSEYDGKVVMAGLAVDEVSEVVDIKEDEIEEPAALMKKHPASKAIIGMAKHKNSVKPLLEVDYLLDHKLLENIAKS
jgi:purine-binding chemotaxis protein CheW